MIINRFSMTRLNCMTCFDHSKACMNYCLACLNYSMAGLCYCMKQLIAHVCQSRNLVDANKCTGSNTDYILDLLLTQIFDLGFF
jgi:hypothetical protein